MLKVVNVFHKNFSFNRLETQTHLVEYVGKENRKYISNPEGKRGKGGKESGREGVRE